MKRVDIVMYDTFVEFYTDKEAFKKRYNEISDGEDFVTDRDLSNNYGFTGYNEEEGKQAILVYINQGNYRDNLAGVMGTLAHEIFHAVMVVCRRIGHNPTREDEPMAYLTGYLFREAADYFSEAFNKRAGD